MNRSTKKKLYILGKNQKIDKNVLLGYVSPRIKVPKPLVIGDNPVIRSGSVIYSNTSIGDNLETGHNVVIREETKIGNNLCIWNNSTIDYQCEIGNNVKIHSNVYISQRTKIEDNVFIAPGATLGNVPHPGCRFTKKCMKGPTLKKGSIIGVNATILPFVTIGENSLIGGGAVVTKDIPSGSVAYGNPAKVVKKVNKLKCKSGITKAPYV